jgi:hypothetical protein
MNLEKIKESKKNRVEKIGLDLKFRYECDNCLSKISCHDFSCVGVCLSPKDFGTVYVDYMCPLCNRADTLFFEDNILNFNSLSDILENLSFKKIRYHSHSERMSSKHHNLYN